LSVPQSKAYKVYNVSYNGRTSYDSNYFYCRIRLEGLLYHAECDMLAIAIILVCYSHVTP